MLEVAMPQLVTGPVAPPTHAESHVTFHESLSALNPLQYVPVIGTIYRAVTGDQIPEPLRRIGTLIVSFLMGGPVGALINVAVTAAEKITGIDVDKTGQALVQGTLPGGPPGAGPPVDIPTPAPVQSAGADIRAPPAPAPLAPASTVAWSSAPASAEAWSSAQLAAYGVGTTLDGTLKLADLRGADVLNSLELSRLQMVRTAYDRATSLTN
jgi:hypothetical protein